MRVVVRRSMEMKDWRPALLTLLLGMLAGVVPIAAADPPGKRSPADSSPGDSSPAEVRIERMPPREPAEALKTFEIAAGFRIELAAHEPEVVDPVAAAFDADGRLYVAEMRDYPFRPQQDQPPLGRVRLLEDRDGDGHFETSHVFAEGLLWPTGVAPWDGGVFVAAAPNIWYFKDTTGDGRADEKKLLFSGFGIQNEQGSVNNLVWGMDGWIYGSSSSNGGQVRRGDQQRGATIEVRGRDFRFHPRTLEFELVSGNGQFGVALDDWGNRFTCSQADPCDHVVLAERYLLRNRHLRVRTAVNDISPGPTPIYRLSPIEAWRAVRSSRRLEAGERGAHSSGLSHDVLDGVAGPAIYRGQAFAPELRGQLFVGDAQNNLVHRRLLTQEGATFDSARADEGTEFLRSNDNWFRPVNVINAPDGALNVLDMAREVIESVHVPLDVFKQIDYTHGRDRGRIYRIVPEGFSPPPRPKLSQASTAELVELLEHRGGWWRDAAQRLLVERQDAAAVEPLRRLVRAGSTPESRVHALYALQQLAALGESDLATALADAHAPVREHALRLAEAKLDQSPALLETAIALANDPAPRVRFQAALSLGEAAGSAAIEDRAVEALAAIAAADGADRWFRTAVLSSCGRWPDRFLRRLLALPTGPESPGVSMMLEPAAELAGRASAIEQTAACLDDWARHRSLRTPHERDAVLLGLCVGASAAGHDTSAMRAAISPAAAELWETALAEARRQAGEAQADSSTRQQAVRLLRLDDSQAARKTLAELLGGPHGESLLRTAIETLSTFDGAEAAAITLAPWSRYSPAVREAALQASLSKPDWTTALLEAIQSGAVPANQIGSTQRSTLLVHAQAPIAERAKAIWSDDNSPRAEVIERYRPAVNETGDALRGLAIFERECAACHKLGEKGHAVGPNLALARHRTADELLVHILDPNREVLPAYIQYVVTDRGGGVFTGLIAADTSASITLRQDRGVERTILKSDIDELSSTDKSLMAEGFEKTISPAEMGDLIAYLMEMRYHIGTNPGHTEPAGE